MILLFVKKLRQACAPTITIATFSWRGQKWVGLLPVLYSALGPYYLLLLKPGDDREKGVGRDGKMYFLLILT